MNEPAPSGMPQVDVWIARDQLLDSPAVSERLSGLLAPDELERREHMAFDARRQQLLTRAMRREVLSRHAPGIAPRDWRFVRAAAGRPSLAPPFDATGIDFNIAHTRGLVAMAVVRAARVGIDVEALDKRVPLAVAQRYFSVREVSALQALPAAEQPRRFLRLWTLKEAYLKATGAGLAGALDGVTFTLDDTAGVRFEAADARSDRWVFREFSPRGYLLALAYLATVASQPPLFRLREFLPEA